LLKVDSVASALILISHVLNLINSIFIFIMLL
jgi:hypothetical protein